MSGILSMITH